MHPRIRRIDRGEVPGGITVRIVHLVESEKAQERRKLATQQRWNACGLRNLPLSARAWSAA